MLGHASRTEEEGDPMSEAADRTSAWDSPGRDASARGASGWDALLLPPDTPDGQRAAVTVGEVADRKSVV